MPPRLQGIQWTQELRGRGGRAGGIKQRTRQCPKGHRNRKEATGVLARWPDVAKELVEGNINLVLCVVCLLSFPQLLLFSVLAMAKIVVYC